MGSANNHALVRATLSHLCTTLANELSAANEASKIKVLLKVIQHLQQEGKVLGNTAGEYPKIDVLISRLEDSDGASTSTCSLFNSEEQGLFLCLGEVLLYTVAPSWLACLSLQEKEELFFQYFDKGPTIQLLKLLTGKVRGKEVQSRNTSHPSQAGDQNLHQKVIEFSRDTAQSILNRVFMERDGMERLVREIQRDDSQKASGGKVVKEVATWVSSMPERLLSMGQLEVATLIFSKTLESATEGILTESQEKERNALTLFLANLTRAFCRRGLASSVAESIHKSIHNERQTVSGNFKCKMMWNLVLPHVRDVYALEHLFHSILLLESRRSSSRSRSNSKERFPDTLDVCLGGSLGVSSDLKVVVLERVLLKRILPLRYLRLVLIFLRQGMEEARRAEGIGALSIEEALYRVSLAWSKEDSLSAFSLGHQASLSMIIIECLRLTNRDKLEQDYPVIPEVLSGVSLRLSSANLSVRYQGMSVAKALSIVLDPSKPLVFDVKVDFEQSLLRDLQEATKDLIEKDLQGDENETQDIMYASGTHSSHVSDIHDAVSYGTNCLDDECEALSLSDESSFESDSDDESSLEAYDMSEDENDLNTKLPSTVGSLIKALRKPDDHENFEFVLKHCEKIISNVDSSVNAYVGDLVRALLYANVPEEFMEKLKRGGASVTPMECKLRGLAASLVKVPLEASRILIADFYSVHLGVSQRLLILDALRLSAIELSGLRPDEAVVASSAITVASSSSLAMDRDKDKGKDVKTKIFAPVSLSRKGTKTASVKNRFAPLSPAFMLPLLCKYDHKGEGLNMLERDFVLLGKLLQTGAVFLKCGGATHQAIELAFTLFEFIASTGVLDHKESFVRKSTLQAVHQIVETIPAFLLVGSHGNEVGGSPLNFEGLQELLLCGAKYDTDEECRLLFAQVLHDLHERCTDLLPKIQI